MISTRLNVDKIKKEMKALEDPKKRKMPYRDLIRYTRLCALRASMRNKLHFSSTTRDSSRHYYRIGEFSDKMTLDMQRRWVEPLIEEFAVTDGPDAQESVESPEIQQ